MTLREFNCWLEGYSVAINEAPTKEQWEIIQEKIKTITPEAPIVIATKESAIPPNQVPFITPIVIPSYQPPTILPYTLTCTNCTN